MRLSPLLPLVLSILAFSLACASKADVPSVRVATYEYTPTESSAGKGISLALIAPSTSPAAMVGMSQGTIASTATLKDAIGTGLLEYFNASGFTVSGPFKSVDEMTFPEKKQADLLLTVEFDLMPFAPSPTKYDGGQYAYDKFTATGDCKVTGGVKFVMWEPLSMQRMWSKSADAPTVTADCTVSDKVQAQVFNAMMADDLAGVYEAAFAATMTTVERYFNAEEVALIKSQAQELREKKVY